MNREGKALVWVLVIISVLLACVAAAGFVISQQETQKRIATEKELANTVVARDKLASEKAKIQSELTDAERRLEETESELIIKKKQIDALTLEIETRDKQIEGLTGAVEKVSAEKDALSQNLAKAENELTQIKETLAKTVEEKNTLEAKLDELKKASSAAQQPVDLPQVTVSQAKNAQDSASQEDVKATEQPQEQHQPLPVESSKRVLKINREFDFIIIDAGQKDGIEIGKGIEIYRDNKLVAKARIEKVYESLSAAAILPEYNKDDIKEGDSVRVL